MSARDNRDTTESVQFIGQVCEQGKKNLTISYNCILITPHR